MPTQKKREILDADIRFISLCPRGKNGFMTLFKADTAEVHFVGLTKELPDFDEKGELLAVVWAPNIPDSDGDFASADVIEKMAHSYMKNAAKVDIVHDCQELSKDAAHVTESFIIQKSDERFLDWPGYDGSPMDVTGGWAVKMQINSPELRKAYRDGEWQGVSLYGPAKVRTDVTKADAMREVIVAKNVRLSNALRAWFEKDGNLDAVELSAFRAFDRPELIIQLTQRMTASMGAEPETAMVLAAKIANDTLNQHPSEEEIMNEEQVKEAIAKAIEEATSPLLAEIEALKKAAEVEIVTSDETVDEEVLLARAEEQLDSEQKSDEELLKEAAETEIADLRKSVDFKDAEQIRAFVAKRREINADLAKALGEECKSGGKPRRNISPKVSTEDTEEALFEKARQHGKNLAAYLNAKQGAK